MSSPNRAVRARRAKQFRARIDALESRELLSGTTLIWSQGVSLPAARGGPAALVSGGSIIVAGGKTTGAATAVNVLGSASSAWSTLPNIDIGRVGPGFVSTTGGILLYGGGGGAGGTTPLPDAFLYDITGANSQDANPMATPRAQFASAGDSSGRAYAIGGVNGGTNLATVERYNPATGTWGAIAALPASRSGAAAAFDGTGSIFVVGGSATVNGTTGTNTLYKYTIATNTWTTLAPLPLNIRDAAAVFATDGTLEVIGGISGGSTVASVETYDPTSNTWTANTPLPSAVSSAVAVLDALGRVEVIGGFNSAKAPVSTVEVTQVVSQPTTAPVITSVPTLASLTVGDGSTFTYTAVASGNPKATYSLVSGPSGMKIDPVNGALSWTSPASLVGTVPVTIKATNALGSATQSFTLNVLDKTAPTAPLAPKLIGETATSVTLSWGASTDNVGVTGYSVYWIYTTGHSGRGGGFTTHTIFLGSSTGTTITIGGLVQNKYYTLFVQASDAAGNRSGYAATGYVVPGAFPTAPGVTTVSSTPSPTAPAYTLNDVANHAWTLQASTTSFAAVTYSLVSPPAGMTIDPATGLISWTPTAAQVGTSTATVVATNVFGSAQSTVSLYVSADVPVPGFIFTNTDSPTFDIVGMPVSLRITDASHTPSTYSIDIGTPGMSIDPVTGVVNWIPTQAGNPQVRFRLTNSAGTATIDLGPVISVASPPQNVSVSGLNTWSPTLTWAPPAYNANLVAGYRYLVSGTNYTMQWYTTYGPALSASLALPYAPGDYAISIQALDAAGNQGLWNTSLSFHYDPTQPNPYYYINSNNGNPTTQVGQPVSIQLADLNTKLPDTYTLVSGPAGVTVDPSSGLVSWTPTAAQVGFQTLNFAVTNSSGSAPVSLQFYVGPTTTDINPPNPTYAFTSNGGGAYAIPGQTVTIQVTDQNTAQPSEYQLQNAPAGMTIDPVSGLITWTPTVADLGDVYPTVLAYNSVGITNLYPTIPVLFASPVNNIVATGSLATQSIDVTWTDPTLVSEPISGYNVYLSWTDSAGTTYTSAATFVPFGTYRTTLAATAGFTNFTVKVVAVDAPGREGAANADTPVTLV